MRSHSRILVHLTFVPWHLAYFGLYDFRKFDLPYISIGFGLFALVLTLPNDQARRVVPAGWPSVGSRG